MDLGHAIKESLDGRSQRSLAQAVGIDSGHLTRIISGQVPGLALDLVLRIEEALDVPQGGLLRAAGIIGADVTVEDAIAADSRLSRAAKQSLLFAYRAALTAADPR